MRVDMVILYFNNFISKFFIIKDLVYVNEDDVLKVWEGLGYYFCVCNL